MSFLLIFRTCAATHESFCRYDNAFITAWHFKRIVLHVFARSSENRVQQFFFRRKFSLALWRNLTDKYVARRNPGTLTHNTCLVKVSQCLFADIGNIACELLASQLRLSNFNTELVYMNTCERVISNQLFADQNGVLKIESVKRHKCHKQVLTKCQRTMVGTAAVCYDLTFLYLLAQRHYRLLIKTRPFIKADELQQLVFVRVVNNDMQPINRRHHSVLASLDDHRRIRRDITLHARTNQRPF